MIEGISSLAGVNQKGLPGDQKSEKIESEELTNVDAGNVVATEVHGGNVPPTEPLPDSGDESGSYGETCSQDRTNPDWSKGRSIDILG